uniref:Uncharacterized protein n=1 Tax=Megaselia scalaris TaxID=36166 RepID=T1GB88_MEGSC
MGMSLATTAAKHACSKNIHKSTNPIGNRRPGRPKQKRLKLVKANVNAIFFLNTMLLRIKTCLCRELYISISEISRKALSYSERRPLSIHEEGRVFRTDLKITNFY